MHDECTKKHSPLYNIKEEYIGITQCATSIISSIPLLINEISSTPLADYYTIIIHHKQGATSSSLSYLPDGAGRSRANPHSFQALQTTRSFPAESREKRIYNIQRPREKFHSHGGQPPAAAPIYYVDPRRNKKANAHSLVATMRERDIKLPIFTS